MNRSDEGFRIVHAERIDPRAVGLSQTRAPETSSRVVLLRMVAVAEVKCTSQNALYGDWPRTAGVEWRDGMSTVHEFNPTGLLSND